MQIPPGQPAPLGATWDGAGVNFALFSEYATKVELLLFESDTATGPNRTIELPERTGPIRHGYVPGCSPGQLYAYRVHGPYDPGEGHRFNPNKVVLDPYARCIGRCPEWNPSLFGYDPADGTKVSDLDSAPHAALGMVVADDFDWKGDASPSIPWSDTIIYETHVKGISWRHGDVAPDIRGTFAGLASRPILNHLLDLGVTTVQLLPVHVKLSEKRIHDMGLTNYWGYNTLNYFCPEPSYAASSGEEALNEFREMVRTLHGAGLEVILDVVYNHTAEGDAKGPTLSFRGIDNRSYYKDDGHSLIDYTGTGNTLDAGNPHVLHLIMDSLRYWVEDMHIDGFRFDLAAALARDAVDVNMLSAFFQVIHQDPVLSGIKLIAEPWDIGPGGYQVGAFPWRWAEWNSRYRDTIRRYWRSDPGMTAETATRLAGSSDLYENSGRKPFASINFVTSHDGLTLEDLVSYSRKHNEANGEENRDGHEPTFSSNTGVEGPAADPAVKRARMTRKKSLMATLFLSQGVPMLLGGDELSRTQSGNNNAYCQDNETSWYDWDLDHEGAEFLAFTCRMIAFRKSHPTFRRQRFLNGSHGGKGSPEVTWWNAAGRTMSVEDWSDAGERALGMLLFGERFSGRDSEGQAITDDTLLLLLNASEMDVEFVLPDAFSRWVVALTCDDLLEGTVIETKDGLRIHPGTMTVLRGEENAGSDQDTSRP